MPLVKETLKQAIISAQQASSGAKSIKQAQELYAESLSTAIDAYIKSGDVIGTSSAGPVAGKVS